MTMSCAEKNQKGLAMLIVIWALVLMIAIATQFAFSMKTDVTATRNFKEDIESIIPRMHEIMAQAAKNA